MGSGPMTTFHVVFVALALATASPAEAQVKRPAPTITSEAVSAPVAPGATTHLRLTVVLPSGLHVQSDKPRDPALIPTALTLTIPAGASILRISYPHPTDLRQAGGGEPLAVFSGTFVIDVELAIARSATSGTLEIPGTLRYQSCTEQVCFPPARAPVTWRVKVSPPQRRVGRLGPHCPRGILGPLAFKQETTCPPSSMN
jgi:DsbC/DsbD-like thiol-disulfide interchange protein